MRRTLVVLLTALVFPISVQATDKIRLAMNDISGQYITFPLAQKKGFFRDEGLDAEIILMRSIVPLASLVKEDIDYYFSIPQGIRGALQGLPVKVVGCYVSSSTLVLLTRPEVKSTKDLRGKTIAVGTIGGAPQRIGQMMLRYFSLDPEKDVKYLAVGPNEVRLAVMKQRLADAAVVTPPFDFEGKKSGFVIVARAYDLFSYPQGGLIVNTNKIKKKPDEIKRVIKAGIKANRYIRTNRDGTIQFLMQLLKANTEVAAATYDSVWKSYNDDGNVPEDGLRLVVEDTKNLINLTRKVSLDEFLDLTILKEAQKELGITEK